MSAIAQPNVLTFKAGGVIVKGHAVKMGADDQHVVECTAKTDKQIGIAQNDASTAEDKVEVALPGGGSKVKAGGSISAGDLLASTTDGTLIATTTAADRYIAMAMEDMSSGDLGAAHVVAGLI